jgi:hypothetical protein
LDCQNARLKFGFFQFWQVFLVKCKWGEFCWFFLVMKTNPVLPARCFLTAPNSNSKVVWSSFVG